MDSNLYSTEDPIGPGGPRPPQPPDELDELTALLDRLAARDLDRLSEVVQADRVLRLRPLVDRLEGQWLKELAGVDARGAAGAEQDRQFGSTAAWLRARLRMAANTAASQVRTARALFRGPLPATAEALMAGEMSVAHAQVLAAGTQHLPDHVALDAEATLLDAARRVDPGGLRRLVGHLQYTLDPDRADAQAQRRHERRGIWLTPTLDQMVAIHGLVEAETGQTLAAALEPLARPADQHDTRSGAQRTADALHELARRQLEGGQLPKAGGVRPQLSVVVDLPSLKGQPGRLGWIGGEVGWAGLLDPEACRRLACDATVTRVLVARQPPDPGGCGGGGDPDELAGGSGNPGHAGHRSGSGLEGLLRAAMTRLPPTLGGAPSMPLNLGRATRVVSPAQHRALAVRDGGCVFPGCSRPLAWCEAHHVWHWLDGGPTDLDNLALVCRAHHRAIHEGGWHLARGPDGQFSATPPPRRHRTAA